MDKPCAHFIPLRISERKWTYALLQNIAILVFFLSLLHRHKHIGWKRPMRNDNTPTILKVINKIDPIQLPWPLGFSARKRWWWMCRRRRQTLRPSLHSTRTSPVPRFWVLGSLKKATHPAHPDGRRLLLWMIYPVRLSRSESFTCVWVYTLFFVFIRCFFRRFIA